MPCVVGVGRVGSLDKEREDDSGERGHSRDTGEFALKFPLVLPLLSAVTPVIGGDAQMSFTRPSCRGGGTSLWPTSVPVRGTRRRMPSETSITSVTYFHEWRKVLE